MIAHCLNAKGGAGRIDGESETFVTHSLRGEGFDASEDGTGRGTPLVSISFQSNSSFGGTGMDVCGTVVSQKTGGGGMPAVMTLAMAVRRLTPTECARLQGFPDNHCDLPGAADGPKYKAYGNSMAVPVIRAIGLALLEVA